MSHPPVEVGPALTFDCPECQHTNYYIPHKRPVSQETLDHIKEATGQELTPDMLPEISQAPESMRCNACHERFEPMPFDPGRMVFGGFPLDHPISQAWTRAYRKRKEPTDTDRTLKIVIDGARGRDDKNLEDPLLGFGRVIVDLPLEIMVTVDTLVDNYHLSPARLFASSVQGAYESIEDQRAEEEKHGN